MRFETIAARGRRNVTSGNRPLTPPLYQTNVFVFDSMAQVEAVWEGKERGVVYGRYGTPNHAMLGGRGAGREEWGGARAVSVEALSNPLLRLVDVEALAAGLAGRGVDLIVDSSLASPAVLRPIGLGASVVLHSATKFISGHGDVTAGVAVGRRAVVERVQAAAIRVGTNLRH